MNLETRRDVLLCPACGAEETHLEFTLAATRPREDGPEIGWAIKHEDSSIWQMAHVPAGQIIGHGRRDRAVLLFSCEAGHYFDLILTQHKGSTYVECLPIPEDE